jgi:hypothetical protein
VKRSESLLGQDGHRGLVEVYRGGTVDGSTATGLSELLEITDPRRGEHQARLVAPDLLN